MISHHHKAIFIHIPKCGGQSVEQMFLNDLGLDWKRRAPLLLRANDVPELGPPRLAHLLACDYVEYRYMPEEQFTAYYKFCVVRDPYSRVVSHFNYMSHLHKRGRTTHAAGVFKLGRNRFNKRKLSFDEFCLNWLPAQFAAGDSDGSKSEYWFVRPQSDYLVGSNGQFLVDDILKLERLDKEIERVRSACNVRSPLLHVNRSSGRTTQEQLSHAHLNVINDLYSKDFAALGYPCRPKFD